MKLLATIATLFIYQLSLAQDPLIGKEAPEVSLQNLDGEITNLSDYRGKVVLLDFWAGWCGPCIADFKEWLVPMYSEYDGKNFEILGVNYDKSTTGWKKSVQRFGLEWDHLYDYDVATAYKDYNVEYIPTSYLIDQNGKIIAKNLKRNQLRKAIDKLLKE